VGGGRELLTRETKRRPSIHGGIEDARVAQDHGRAAALDVPDPSDSEYANLFNSGKIGMLVTGPWDLSGVSQRELRRASYAVISGLLGGHQNDFRPRQLGGLQQRRGPRRRRREVHPMVDGAEAGQVLLAQRPATSPRTSVANSRGSTRR